eukprot:3725534-Pyramimonas_sp.AAC.1
MCEPQGPPRGHGRIHTTSVPPSSNDRGHNAVPRGPRGGADSHRAVPRNPRRSSRETMNGQERPGKEGRRGLDGMAQGGLRAGHKGCHAF